MQNKESCGSFQINNKPFKFELFQEQVVHQQQFCYAIAINDNNNLLTTSAYKNIKIHYFNKGKMKQLKEIQKHQGWITTLNFFKKRPNFVSGSQDASIIIWFSILMPVSKFMMKLNVHSRAINCVIISQIDENLFISASGDGTIRFWSSLISNSSQWLCYQTINEHTNSIYECSLNEDASQLISCSQDCKILIIDRQQNQKWQVKQIIQMNRRGYRLKFIDYHTFVFLSYSSNHLRVYKLNVNSNNQEEYINIQNIPIQGSEQACMCYFPSQYNKQKNLLIIKNGYYVNCLRLIPSHYSTQLLDCEQSFNIDFNSQTEGNIFGTLSDDGEFLIFWDAYSRTFQVRKYSENI
ncbi:unnamed protein product [Paramecium sonneborni]|uniref:Uncharacterized protein n=1 Tax=Paramecium sonneborni TaxID=65129 RepID=A0A8S1LBK3_9CILI|nr:unnamed protein product [Paramecium sonneborni]